MASFFNKLEIQQIQKKALLELNIIAKKHLQESMELDKKALDIIKKHNMSEPEINFVKKKKRTT